MKIPLRVAIPMSNSLEVVTGQNWAQSPQATQALASTQVALLEDLDLEGAHASGNFLHFRKH